MRATLLVTVTIVASGCGGGTEGSGQGDGDDGGTPGHTTSYSADGRHEIFANGCLLEEQLSQDFEVSARQKCVFNEETGQETCDVDPNALQCLGDSASFGLGRPSASKCNASQMTTAHRTNGAGVSAIHFRERLAFRHKTLVHRRSRYQELCWLRAKLPGGLTALGLS